VPFRGVRIQEQFAVLIGGYKDMDSARRALDKVKKLPPPTAERLCRLYTRLQPVDSPDGEKRDQIEGAYINPFPTSFVTPNPTVPQNRHAELKNDPFLKQLNAGESLSLLKCKKPWTLVVAVFPGMSTIKPAATTDSFWDRLWNTKGPDGLSAGAINA